MENTTKVKDKKGISREHLCLTKKQLLKQTSMYSDKGPKTIGECTLHQLQRLLYESYRELEMIDGKLQKAYSLIQDCLP